MRIMIHAYPGRMWYVKGYQVPQLLKQGIRKEDIYIWNDVQGRGNLEACMDCFAFCGQNDVGGTWHLTDDALPSYKFAELAEKLTDDVVCGYCMSFCQSAEQMVPGIKAAEDMWWSFPCIRISDKLAGECEEWFRTKARFNPAWKYRVDEKKYDDSFFYDFMKAQHPGHPVNDYERNLVNHVQDLLGGSVLTKRPPDMEKQMRAALFVDMGEEAELLAWIEKKKGETVDR